MKKIQLFASTYLLFIMLTACTSSISGRLRYIDARKPGLEPQVFAKDFISQDSISEFGSVFNRQGNEFFYGVNVNGKSEIRFSRLERGAWTEPKTIISHTNYSFNDPFLSPKEDRLYYISDMPRNKQDTIQDYDIWYSNRTGNEWSEPVNAGPFINSDHHEYYISFTADGTMYFASNKDNAPERKHDFDIYSAAFAEGAFQTPEKISDSINTRAYEADVFISPDETYIIFCAARRSGLGQGDLYISFKDEQGHWRPAINMGAPVNSEGHELCPFVTKDGQYFFYTSNKDIYWVSTEVIKRLKTRK